MNYTIGIRPGVPERFLSELIDLNKGRFLATEEIVPNTKEVAKFQEVIDEYRRKTDVKESGRAGHFEAKDVAIKERERDGQSVVGLVLCLTRWKELFPK